MDNQDCFEDIEDPVKDTFQVLFENVLKPVIRMEIQKIDLSELEASKLREELQKLENELREVKRRLKAIEESPISEPEPEVVETLTTLMSEKPEVDPEELRNDGLRYIAIQDSSEVLYVIGGFGDEPNPDHSEYPKELSSVSCYDPSEGQWQAVPPLPFKLYITGCLVVDKKIFVYGGDLQKSTPDRLYCFDTGVENPCWELLRAMRRPRQLCAIVHHDGYIYAAGGSVPSSDEFSDSSSDIFGYSRIVERYSIAQNCWESCPSMLEERGGLEMVEMDGYLYAIGGQRPEVPLQCIERYDPRERKWQSMTNLNGRYSNFGSAVLGGRIYIAGNCVEEERDYDHSFRFEVYSPETNRCHLKPVSVNSRVRFGVRLAVLNGELLAIGGTSLALKGEKIGLKVVEYYDFVKHDWMRITDLDAPRGFHGVAVVKTS